MKIIFHTHSEDANLYQILTIIFEISRSFSFKSSGLKLVSLKRLFNSSPCVTPSGFLQGPNILLCENSFW